MNFEVFCDGASRGQGQKKLGKQRVLLSYIKIEKKTMHDKFKDYPLMNDRKGNIPLFYPHICKSSKKSLKPMTTKGSLVFILQITTGVKLWLPLEACRYQSYTVFIFC